MGIIKKVKYYSVFYVAKKKNFPGRNIKSEILLSILWY